MKRSVFISHSSGDKPVAEEVRAFLEKNGVPCWIAPRDVMPGENYGAAILDAIDECRVFLLILSHHSNQSNQVAREVERAASSDSIIIPFRIEDVQPSRNLAFYVSSAHWLDAAEKPVQRHYGNLLAAIQDWQKNEGTEQTAKPSDVAPPPLPVVAAQRSAGHPTARVAMLIGALALLSLGGLFLYKMSVRHKADQTTGVREIRSLSPVPVTPMPSDAPLSTPEETVTPSAAPALPETTAPPTATVARRKPGEPLHSPAGSEPPAVAPSVSAPRLRPGQPLNSSLQEPSPPTPTTENAPVVHEVAASSQLNESSGANLAFDGNRDTAWVPKGKLVDQSISVHFKSPAVIRAVSILNGVGQDEERYRSSNRIKTLRIMLSDGTNKMVTFKDELKMQRFEKDRPAMANWIKFEILSAFRG
ncbi:MAG: hypothetical protein JWO45_948, partial [Spartobacteria bacterium]|nr:hypothetical protein [Spartobacteria bacterium]